MLTLTQQALSLPYQARAELLSVLRESLDVELAARQIMTAKDLTRAETLYALMSETVGFTVSRKSRMVTHVDARMMIGYRLLEEGYTTSEVGKMMGKDHATVVYLRKRMLDMFNLPLVYDNELDVWRRFNEKIQDYDNNTNKNAN